MQTVGAFEAKNTLGTLLDRVQKGEEIVITRHGKAVARLVSSDGATNRTQRRAAAARIHQRASSVCDKATWTELKQYRDAGRP